MVRIPEHSELEIDSVISRQNVAKEGWTTYYVDGENGNDANNGLRWETAFKTIQHALDVARGWAKIYVRADEYDEALVFNYPNVRLIGEDRFTTKLIPSSLPSGAAVSINAQGCSLTNFDVSVESFNNVIAIMCNSSFITIDNLFLRGGSSHTNTGIYISGTDSNEIKRLVSYDFYAHVLVFGASDNLALRSKITDSHFGGGTFVFAIDNYSYYNLFYNNFIFDITYGVYCMPQAEWNSIFHNNFMSNITNKVYSETEKINVFENYYYDHSNVDNGFGIATEPYVFHDDIADPRPVVVPDGWLVLGQGGNTIKSVPVAGTYTHPNDTNEHDVLEFSAETQDIFISLDVSALTQPVEIREYEKIDGTNYRQISLKTYPDDFDTGTDAITIYFKQKNKDYKVTLKSTASEGASRDIPYVYRTDGKV